MCLPFLAKKEPFRNSLIVSVKQKQLAATKRVLYSFTHPTHVADLLQSWLLFGKPVELTDLAEHFSWRTGVTSTIYSELNWLSEVSDKHQSYHR